MLNNDELRGLFGKILDLDAAGLWNDAKEEIAHRIRQRPARPIDGLTENERATAHWLASAAKGLFDVPADDALHAAVELYVPSRLQIACEVIELYAARLDGAARPQEIQAMAMRQPSRPVVVSVRGRKGE